MGYLRIRKKVSVLKCLFSKRSLSVCLCVGFCVEYRAYENEWVDVCKLGVYVSRYMYG